MMTPFLFLIYISQFIVVWTQETKSLLPSLYKREEFPLFGKEGAGEISRTICLLNYGLLSNILLIIPGSIYHVLRYESINFSLFFWRHSPGDSFHHFFPILVGTGCPKFCSVFFWNQFDHFHFGCNGIPNSNWRKELDLLRKVDGSMSGMSIS